MFGRLTPTSVTRQARNHGLIGPEEDVIAVESGACSGFRNAAPTYALEETTLGFTRRRLVLMSGRRVAAVDLVNLIEVELVSATADQHLRITAVRDRDPGFASWTFRAPTVASFAAALEEAAAARRADQPDLARVFRDWGDEMRRRNLASREIADVINVEVADAFVSALEMPVQLRSVADEPRHAVVEPLFLVDGSLLALRDGRVIFVVDVDGESSPVAMFRSEDVTFLALPALSAASSVGTWEIGFRWKHRERRVIFHGPCQSLYGGDGGLAEGWLRASGLSSVATPNQGPSWLSPSPSPPPEVHGVHRPTARWTSAGSRPGKRKRR